MIHLRFPSPYSMAPPPPPPAHHLPPPPPQQQLWTQGQGWSGSGGVVFSDEEESQSASTTPICISYTPQQDARESSLQGRAVMLQSIEESDQEGMSSSMIDYGEEAEHPTASTQHSSTLKKTEEEAESAEADRQGSDAEEPSAVPQATPTSSVAASTTTTATAISQASHPTLVAVTPPQDLLSSKTWRCPQLQQQGEGGGSAPSPSFSTFKPQGPQVKGPLRSPPPVPASSSTPAQGDRQRGGTEGKDDNTGSLVDNLRDVTPSNNQSNGSTVDHVPRASQVKQPMTELVTQAPYPADGVLEVRADTTTTTTTTMPSQLLGFVQFRNKSISKDENRNSDIIIDTDLVKKKVEEEEEEEEDEEEDEDDDEEESSLSEVSDEEDEVSDEDLSEDRLLSCKSDEESGKRQARKEEVSLSGLNGNAHRSHLPVKMAAPVSSPMSSHTAADKMKASKDNGAHVSPPSSTASSTSSSPDVFKSTGKTDSLPKLPHSKIPQKQAIPCQYVLPQRVPPADPKADADDNKPSAKESPATALKAKDSSQTTTQKTPQLPRKALTSQLPRKLVAGQQHVPGKNLMSSAGQGHEGAGHVAEHVTDAGANQAGDKQFSRCDTDVHEVFTAQSSSNKFSATASPLGSHLDGRSGGQLSAGRSLIPSSQMMSEGGDVSVSAAATTAHRQSARGADRAGDCRNTAQGADSSLPHSSPSSRKLMYQSSSQQHRAGREEQHSAQTEIISKNSGTENSSLSHSSAAAAWKHKPRDTDRENGFSSSSSSRSRTAYTVGDSEETPSRRGKGAEVEEEQEGRRPNSRTLMTRSHSDAMDMDSSDEDTRPQFSTWHRKRKLSSEELTSPGRREGCVRSFSQDNFLKTQKNICNRIVKYTEETNNSSSSAASHYMQSCTSSSPPSDPAASSDNRLAEHQRSLSQGPAGGAGAPQRSRHGSQAADFNQSWEKADSEKSIQDDLSHPPYPHHRRFLNSKATDDDSDDYADDKEEEDEEENDDEEESDLDEDETYTLEETEDHVKPIVANKGSFDDEDLSFQHDEEDGEEDCDEDEDRRLPIHGQEKGSAENQRGVLEHEISAEDELLLLENANLIVSEIVTKRDMSVSSTVEEDLLIENETLSLVSNDYTSDTESEVSACWSAHSDKQNEQICVQEEPVARGRPRIVKPNEAPPPTVVKEEEEVKGIRGRRKPLYSKPTLATASRTAARADPNRAAGSGRGVTGGVASSARPVRGQAGRTSQSAPGAGRGSALPRTSSRPQLKSGIPAARGPQPANTRTTTTTPPGKGSSLPKPQTAATASQGRSASASSIAKPSSGRSGSTPPSRLPSSASRGKLTTERPKPPTKQATFVKDSPATPTTEEKGGVNQRSHSAANSSQNEKRSTIPTKTSAAAGGGGGGVSEGKRGQTEPSAPQKPSAKETSTPSKTSPGSKLQRPSNIARAVQNGSPAKAAGGGDGKSGGGSTPSSPNSPKGPAVSSKSGLPTRGGLNKAGSAAATTRRTGTGLGMTKASSGSSLKDGTASHKGKVPVSKGDIKKSESSASLRRGSGVSTPSSPKFRRSSLSTPTKEKAGGEESKRPGQRQQLQQPSKIAGLKKEKGPVSRSVSLEESTSMASSFKPRSKSSSLPASARNMSLSSSPAVRKSSSVVSPSSATSQSGDEEQVSRSKDSILTRSSTYDKLPSSHVRPIFHLESEEESDAAEDTAPATRDPPKPEENPQEREASSAHEASTAVPSLQTQDVVLEEPHVDEVSLSPPSDHHNSMETCFKNSSDDSIACENDHLLAVTSSNIDSSTWRKKHQPPREGEVCLQLPNADETCRSLSSLFSTEDEQSQTDFPANNIFEFDECEGSAGKKNRSTNGNAGEKKSKNKTSVAKSIKSTFAGLKFFNSKTTRYQVKIEISKHSPTEPLPFTSTVSTGTSTDSQSRSVYTPKPSSGAIVAPVAPFNYSPPSSSTPSSMTTSTPATVTTSQDNLSSSTKDAPHAELNQDDPLQKKAPVITEHLTKTEMLLARRRQVYLNNNNKQNQQQNQQEEKAVTARGCMVTTV